MGGRSLRCNGAHDPATAHRPRTRCTAPAALLLGAAAQAQVYMGSDAQGTLVLSNHASSEAPELLLAAPADPAAAAASAKQRCRRRPRHRCPARSAPRRSAMPCPVAAGGGDRRRVGLQPEGGVARAGAKGLMQLMPETARRFGVKDVFAVQQNIDGGAAYLRWLLTQFDNDLQLALAAYNAGEGAVARAGRRVPGLPGDAGLRRQGDGAPGLALSRAWGLFDPAARGLPVPAIGPRIKNRLRRPQESILKSTGVAMRYRHSKRVGRAGGRGFNAARTAGGDGDHRPARRHRRAAVFRADRQVQHQGGARADRVLRPALDQYRLDVGQYPSTEQGLLALRAAPQQVPRWQAPT